MLQIRELTITHRKDLRTILDRFSCTLNHGDKAVIIGEEGNGKSTLLKWIYDPMLIEEYADAEGICTFKGEKLAYLPQELPEEDRELTVYEFFCKYPFFHEISPKELIKQTSRFGFDPDFCYRDRIMGTLSGGEKVKTQMLRILIEEPTVLLLDEPSNDLDIEMLEWIEKLIIDFKGIVLFISHDETLIENTANVVIHLEQLYRKTECRYTVARLPYAVYTSQRLNALEYQEQQARQDIREKKIRDEKFRKIAQKVEQAQDNISQSDPHGGRLLKKKMKAVKSMERRFSREDESMTEMPYAEEAINFRLGSEENVVPNGKTVLEFGPSVIKIPGEDKVLAHDVELTVRGPEKIGIIGRNGIGKTTLIKEIVSSLEDRRDIRVEYMPQNYTDLLDPEKTPVQSICRSGDPEERKTVRNWLAALKFTAEEMEHPVKELSGGQKAKIFLLRMNTFGANVLILDEPTRNFSPLSSPVIRAMLRDFPGAIISVSHDRKYLSEVCTKVLTFTEDGLKDTI
ncbi:MAG: ABC-F family ATP-binding cassette domain-containing protein [Oscillospiraceae bacterium]|nr:ABC-F family ATP-binding cassette domain-containing protein [Oscillospiraceae bacterium]